MCAGCADKSNPVLPGSGGSNPNGSLHGKVVVDGGSSADALADAQDAMDTSSALDGGVMVCDLLNPACPNKSDGCYPVVASGTGNCMPAGQAGFTIPCALGEDRQQPCVPGLACIPMSSFGLQDQCLYLCSTVNPIQCSPGVVCQPLPGFPKGSNVGFCMPF